MSRKKRDSRRVEDAATGGVSRRADDLLKALLILSRTVDGVLESRSVEGCSEPLSRSKVQVLRLLEFRGPSTLSDIATHLGVSRPAVTQIVDSLEESALVERTKSDEDRRTTLLRLAEAGREILAKVIENQRHIVRSAMRDVSEARAHRWVETVERIVVSLVQADRAFERFCFQCRAHADGTCILAEGDHPCPYVEARDRRRSQEITKH
jgi:DNA-binding MarR family transcriptional regulator